jgi:hypothetical protein
VKEWVLKVLPLLSHEESILRREQEPFASSDFSRDLMINDEVVCIV